MRRRPVRLDAALRRQSRRAAAAQPPTPPAADPTATHAHDGGGLSTPLACATPMHTRSTFNPPPAPAGGLEAVGQEQERHPPLRPPQVARPGDDYLLHARRRRHPTAAVYGVGAPRAQCHQPSATEAGVAPRGKGRGCGGAGGGGGGGGGAGVPRGGGGGRDGGETAKSAAAVTVCRPHPGRLPTPTLPPHPPPLLPTGACSPPTAAAATLGVSAAAAAEPGRAGRGRLVHSRGRHAIQLRKRADACGGSAAWGAPRLAGATRGEECR